MLLRANALSSCRLSRKPRAHPVGHANVTGAQAAPVLSVQSPLTVGRQAPSFILTYFSPAQSGGSCDCSHLEEWVDQEPLLVPHSGPCSTWDDMLQLSAVASPRLPLCSQERMESVVSLSSHRYFSQSLCCSCPVLGMLPLPMAWP